MLDDVESVRQGFESIHESFFFSDGVGGIVGDKAVFVTPAHPFPCWLPYHAAVLIIFLLLQANYLEKPLRS